MNICKIDILNFRGIKNASILVSENAVFVGDNNLGKSTLFEAIDLVMHMAPISVGGYKIGMLPVRKSFCQFAANSICFLRRNLTRLKGLS